MEISTRYVNDVAFVTLTNSAGFSLTLCEQGASVYEIRYKGKSMNMVEATPEAFLASKEYYGRTVGRLAGRFENGDFSAGGVSFKITSNEGPNALHGGPNNFSFRTFKMDIFSRDGRQGVAFHLHSPDKDNGCPGNLSLTVMYYLTSGKPEFEIEMAYRSDAVTPINLTNHLFFNLGGKEDVLGHSLMVPANKAMTYRHDLIPLGYAPVTPTLDFRKPKLLGKDIKDPSLYDTKTNGYDHSYYVGEHAYEEPIAVLSCYPISLEVRSDAPSVQVYSDNYPDLEKDLNIGKGRMHGGVAIEPALAPLDLTSMLIKKDTTYRRRMTYTFKEER